MIRSFRLYLLIVYCLLLIGYSASATGYDIKTSSVIAEPSVEILGDYKGNWYVIGFEKPGTLNKPPQYKLYKYEQGFKTGKISPLYPSFGEKTVYLQAAFVNNKISLFYAKCGKREDVTVLLDKRDDRRQLPVIMQQDYDPNTLEPVGDAKTIFNEEDEYFAPCSIEICESPDRSKTAILFKPYYKQQRYKITIADNTTGEAFSKTFDFKQMKEYLKFVRMKVNNNGMMLIETKVREDVVALSQSAGTKGQTKYYFFSIGKNTDEKAKPQEMVCQPGKYFRDPVVTALNGGEMIVAYDYFANAQGPALKGTVVVKYDENLSLSGEKEIVPDSKFAAQVTDYHGFKKGKEFTNLKTQQIISLPNSSFVLVQEYCDTIRNADKTMPGFIERNYLIACRFDESLNVTSQHFIPKRQMSSTVGYAFSVKGFAKGNDAFLFYNGDWEADEEHNMNLNCTRLYADGSEPETKKVMNTSSDFFTSMERAFTSADGKILFGIEKAVDYEDVSREVKLLEVTVK